MPNIPVPRLRALRTHGWWIAASVISGFAAGWGLTGGSLVWGVAAAVVKGGFWAGLVLARPGTQAVHTPRARRSRPAQPARTPWITRSLRGPR